MTKKNKERIRLEREDQKTKLEIWSLWREGTRSGFYKELEKSKSIVKLGDILLSKLAVQDNTLKELLRKLAVYENTIKELLEANSSNKTENHTEGKANLKKMKHKTIEALRILKLHL